MILPFGKHKGKPLLQVAQEHPDYILWMKANLTLTGGLSWGIDYYVDLIEKGVKIEAEKPRQGKFTPDDIKF